MLTSLYFIKARLSLKSIYNDTYCFNLHLLDYNFPTCLFILSSYMKNLFMSFLHTRIPLSCFSMHPHHLFYYDKIYVTWNLWSYPFLIVQFSGIKYTHIAVQPSSCKTNSVPIKQLPIPPSLQPLKTTFLLCLYELDYSRCLENHTVFVILCLILPSINVFEVHSCCSVCQDSLPF